MILEDLNRAPTGKDISIGIMGGTFDPIHYGHLLAAQEALSALNLDEVIFVPTGDSYHKTGHSITGAEDRYMMTFLATLNNPRFSVSRIEIDRREPSYTVNTLREMSYWFQDRKVKFHFLTGADAVMTMHEWNEFEEIPNLADIVVVSRPDVGFEGYHYENLPPDMREKIISLDIPLLSISSTEIRQRVRGNHNIRYLLPNTVEEYIAKRGLYREG